MKIILQKPVDKLGVPGISWMWPTATRATT